MFFFEGGLGEPALPPTERLHANHGTARPHRSHIFMLRRVLGRGHSSRDALGLATPVCGSLEDRQGPGRRAGAHQRTARPNRCAVLSHGLDAGPGRRRHHARRGPRPQSSRRVAVCRPSSTAGSDVTLRRDAAVEATWQAPWRGHADPPSRRQRRSLRRRWHVRASSSVSSVPVRLPVPIRLRREFAKRVPGGRNVAAGGFRIRGG